MKLSKSLQKLLIGTVTLASIASLGSSLGSVHADTVNQTSQPRTTKVAPKQQPKKPKLTKKQKLALHKYQMFMKFAPQVTLQKNADYYNKIANNYAKQVKQLQHSKQPNANQLKNTMMQEIQNKVNASAFTNAIKAQKKVMHKKSFKKAQAKYLDQLIQRRFSPKAMKQIKVLIMHRQLTKKGAKLYAKEFKQDHIAKQQLKQINHMFETSKFNHKYLHLVHHLE